MTIRQNEAKAMKIGRIRKTADPPSTRLALRTRYSFLVLDNYCRFTWEENCERWEHHWSNASFHLLGERLAFTANRAATQEKDSEVGRRLKSCEMRVLEVIRGVPSWRGEGWRGRTDISIFERRLVNEPLVIGSFPTNGRSAYHQTSECCPMLFLLAEG